MLDIDEHLEGHERLGSVISGSNHLDLNKTHQQSFKITHSDASSIHTARGFISRSNEIRNIIAQKLRQKARPRSTHSKLHRGPDYRRNWIKEKQHLIMKKLESKIRQNYDAGRKKKKRSKSSKQTLVNKTISQDRKSVSESENTDSTVIIGDARPIRSQSASSLNNKVMSFTFKNKNRDKSRDDLKIFDEQFLKRYNLGQLKKNKKEQSLS